MADFICMVKSHCSNLAAMLLHHCDNLVIALQQTLPQAHFFHKGYFTRRFVLCLTLCHFVLVFFSPFSIAITSLGEERANLGVFRTFVRFVFVWICRFPLSPGIWEGLRFVIVALPGLFSYLFFLIANGQISSNNGGVL